MPSHYHYPEILPLEPFTTLIEEATLELQKSQLFLNRAKLNPMLLFKEAHIYLRSPRNIVSTVMTTSYLKDDLVTPHAFQVYLANQLNVAYNEWIEKQELNYEVSILVRNPDSFPSLFAVYVNEREVLQFNIFEQWYGIHEQFPTLEELQEQYRKSEEYQKETLEKDKTAVDYLKNVKAKPWAFVRKPKDVRLLLFKRGLVDNNIQEKIIRKGTQMQDTKFDLQNQFEDIQITFKSKEHAKRIAEQMSMFFIELGYTLEKRTSKLY